MRMIVRTSLLFAGVVLGFAMIGCSGTAPERAEQLGTVTEPLTTTYQAENAFDIDEGVIETQHAGYRGTGYLNINNFSNTFAWYIVERPIAGTVAVTVRYANGSSSNRPIDVTVGGGGSARITGAPTGSWSSWATATVNIAMAAGSNDLTLSSVVADGMPNIDEFSLSQTFTRTYQAEAAFDIDEGVIETIHPGYTGTGYLNINNFNNTFAWYIVDSPAALTVPLTVRYANGSGTNRPIQVFPGGGQVTGAPTGSWSTWVTATVNVPLAAGDNDVILSSVVNDGMPNVDKFDITW
jgi:hypothetical protein